ncbi:MAG: metallophosphatase [Candidatus Eisenbacteria bacterium]
MITRREFLRRGGAGLASFGLAGLTDGVSGWFEDAWGTETGETLITILHTNDVHSRIDPFPEDGSRNAGMAGAARRATLIRRIRDENPNTLLLDAGDTFQGTPYFNLFRGEVDFRVMTALGYDAMTIGNHDFDGGMDGLAQAARFAEFELISANYDFSGTALANRVKPYLVRPVGKIRVGIFGLGVGLDGLVSESLRPGVGYADPFPVAESVVRRLREQERCALVICLSHLGHKGYAGDPGDQDLARQVAGIDLIVGGHSHTFMDAPERTAHGDRETLVYQVGWGGIYLGRVDFRLTPKGELLDVRAMAVPVDASVHASALPVDALPVDALPVDVRPVDALSANAPPAPALRG